MPMFDSVKTFLKQKRQSDHGADDVSQQNGVGGGSVFLLSHAEHQNRHGHAADDRQNISGNPVKIQIISKEEKKSGEYDNQRYPVRPLGAFVQEPVSEKNDINRKRVLQKDGVGGGCQFGGHDEKKLCAHIADSAHNLQTRPAKPGRALQKDPEHDRGQDAAAAQNRQGLPGNDFDQQAAAAPEYGRQNQKEYGLTTCSRCVHLLS